MQSLHLFQDRQYQLETENSITFGPRCVAQCCCDMSVNSSQSLVTGCWVGLSVPTYSTTGALWVQRQRWWALWTSEPLSSPSGVALVSAVPKGLAFLAANRSHHGSRTQGLPVDFSDQSTAFLRAPELPGSWAPGVMGHFPLSPVKAPNGTLGPGCYLELSLFLPLSKPDAWLAVPGDQSVQMCSRGVWLF